MDGDAVVPGCRLARMGGRTSDVDEHHGHHRYHWAIHLDDELLLAGFDVAVTNPSGRVEKVIGFFGPLELNSSAS